MPRNPLKRAMKRIRWNESCRSALWPQVKRMLERGRDVGTIAVNLGVRVSVVQAIKDKFSV